MKFHTEATEVANLRQIDCSQFGGLIIHLNRFNHTAMKMNNLLTATLILFALSAAAQTSQIDQRIVAKYGQNMAQTMAQKSPDQILWYTYWADHGFEIVDQSTMPGTTAVGALDLASTDPSQINLLTLPVMVFEHENRVYAINGTNKFLVVKARGPVAQAFRDSQ